jgi:hypothetical protein
MEERPNCWEFMRCGREAGGIGAERAGVCPAATDQQFDGVNGGSAAGRFCWAVAGTLCRRELRGTLAREYRNCFECLFYKEVARQERSSLVVLPRDAHR